MHIDQQGRGLFVSFRRVASLFLAIGKTRIELLGNELEEEWQHVLRMLLIALGILSSLIVFMVVAVQFLSIVLIEHQALVLGISALFFLMLAIWLIFIFKKNAQRKTNMFATSLAEFEEDIRQFKAAMNDEQQG